MRSADLNQWSHSRSVAPLLECLPVTLVFSVQQCDSGWVWFKSQERTAADVCRCTAGGDASAPSGVDERECGECGEFVTCSKGSGLNLLSRMPIG